MNLIEKFDLFLFDLDGVIYIGRKPVSGAARVIKTLRENNKKIIFLTNNPARSAHEYSNILKKFNISAKPGDIVTSTKNMCFYLENKIKHINKKKAYVIGSTHFKNSIRKTGIKLVNSKKIEGTDYVIMGGHRKFNFDEINYATLHIRNGAKLIATNRDRFYPTDRGFSPATGALLSAIETATGKTALIAGKPEKHIFELAMKTAGIKSKKRTVIIGDNIETDIKGGNNFGISTVLSLTGITKRMEIKKSAVKPDFVINSLSSIIS